MEKISSKALVTALREGKITEPNYFSNTITYIEKEHMDMDDEVMWKSVMAVHRPHIKQKENSSAADVITKVNDSKERYGFMTGHH